MSNEMIELQPIKNEFEEADESQEMNFGAPYENIFENEKSIKREKKTRYSTIRENTTAGKLWIRVPEAPENFIELVSKKKCIDCNNILGTITAALAHYNCTKHQTKLASLFQPDGLYNLPLSKEEIRELEMGPVKNEVVVPVPRKMLFRDLIKQFDIKEDVRKLDMEFCQLCHCPLSSKISALQHYASKRHKKHVENRSAAFELSANLRCDICNVPGSSSESMEEHMVGRKHHVKLKAYLDRVNRGTIAPPMSARGFCDFNNVEREEANPLDASKFVREEVPALPVVVPIINRVEPQVPVQTALGPFVSHTEPQTINVYNVPGMLPEPAYRSLQPLYERDFHPMFGAMAHNYGMPAQVPFAMGNYGMPETPMTLFGDGRVHQTVVANQVNRTQIHSPYAHNMPERVVNKVPVQSFGPTKFQYSRKLPSKGSLM